MRKRLVVAAAIALAATGCSSDGGNDKASDQGGEMPACSDVWVKGATLPDNYDGCTVEGGIVAAVTYDCKDGTQFTAYDDKLYAVLGGEIKDATSPTYDKDYNACLSD